MERFSLAFFKLLNKGKSKDDAGEVNIRGKVNMYNPTVHLAELQDVPFLGTCGNHQASTFNAESIRKGSFIRALRINLFMAEVKITELDELLNNPDFMPVFMDKLYGVSTF